MRPARFRRAGAALAIMLLLTLAQCAGGYDGPPETNFGFERSHGRP